MLNSRNPHSHTAAKQIKATSPHLCSRKAEINGTNGMINNYFFNNSNSHLDSNMDNIEAVSLLPAAICSCFMSFLKEQSAAHFIKNQNIKGAQESIIISTMLKALSKKL